MFPQSTTYDQTIDRDSSRGRMLFAFFNQVYAWMFAGLAVTSLVAWAVSSSPAVMKLIYANQFGYVALGLAAFAIAWSVQGVAMRVNATLATALFILYAAVVGALISGVFLMYPLSTLTAAFLVTGGTFGVMSVLGYFTKMDLTRVGGILSMAAIGLFIGSIVNVFFASDAFSWFITYAVLIVFVGLVAYYTQKLKNWALDHGNDPEMSSRLAIVGSLMLYVAFINIFLSILRIMGSRK